MSQGNEEEVLNILALFFTFLLNKYVLLRHICYIMLSDKETSGPFFAYLPTTPTKK